MSERRKQKGGKRKGKGFVDVVHDGFIRYTALRKWREVEGMIAAGTSTEVVLQEAGRFPERGRYRAIWEECWEAHVRREAQRSPLVGAIEAAVGEAVERETEERKRNGDRALDEGPDFKEFIDGAFERLFAEEAETLEELD
ncbi:MAG: hypothetical protein ACE5JD_14170 [Candidatus Methylomirabilia bacterium]